MKSTPRVQERRMWPEGAEAATKEKSGGTMINGLTLRVQGRIMEKAEAEEEAEMSMKERRKSTKDGLRPRERKTK